jgi:hypothetical protein
MTTIHSIPEPGQLVRLRQRQYVVTDVRQSGLLPQALAGLQRSQHWVSMVSIEDDAMGEELQTIWELEPGAHVYERVELPRPDGFDPSDRLDAFLDAVRWGASSSADIRNLVSAQ